jgi:hypothetical protein
MAATRYGDVVKLQVGAGSVCTAPAPNTTTPGKEIVMPSKRTASPASEALAEPWVYNDRRRRLKSDHARAYNANERASQYGCVGRLTAADVRRAMAGGGCFYCGSSDRLGIDHREPLSAGGPNTADNIVPCCLPCNDSKGLADRPHRWSALYDACQGCGTTERAHDAKGLCRRCYGQARYAAR